MNDGGRLWTIGMMKTVLCIIMVGMAANAFGAPPPALRPFEASDWSTEMSEIDKIILENLQKRGIRPANPCSDAVFIRRIYLDLTGTLPTVNEVRDFLKDRSPGKRRKLIDRLMETEEFADYWTLKWCDLLRVKAEFPINMWPNGVQAYARWIHQAMRENMPYDEFARALLTSSGSNFRVPPVNFYRGIQGEEASTIAAAVGLTFMGVRVDKWDEERRKGLEAFFSRVAYKGTAEWKEVIVYPDPSAVEPLKATFPDGKTMQIAPDKDPREVFADWLVSGNNPWFARNIVNRAWSWFLGRGLIHEPDDIRPDNPAVHPRVLEHLEKELVKSDYDLRHVFRTILNSRTYQQSPVPYSEHPAAPDMFACYRVRRLDAEVLIDAICEITGTRETYSSMIPEPYTFVPDDNRSVELVDGSITSQFLKMFGRPARDTGLESERNNRSNEAQRLHMLNSTHIQKKIDGSWRLRNLQRVAKNNQRVLTDLIYLTVLSRLPTDKERKIAAEYYRTSRLNNRQATTDLAWALINSNQFLYRH